MSELFPILNEFEGACKQDNIYPVCTPLIQLKNRFPSDKQEWLSMEIKKLKIEPVHDGISTAVTQYKITDDLGSIWMQGKRDECERYLYGR